MNNPEEDFREELNFEHENGVGRYDGYVDDEECLEDPCNKIWVPNMDGEYYD